MMYSGVGSLGNDSAASNNSAVILFVLIDGSF